MKRALLLSLALLSLAACSHATLNVPSGFARVDGKYDFRAVNPQGVVVAARLEKNDPRSDLGFWASAVDLKLARKGYTRTADSDVKSQDGVAGKMFKYDAGGGNGYWVAVFSTPNHVLVTEATGYQKDMDASAKQIEAALLSGRAD